jgi:hypothetical protein
MGMSFYIFYDEQTIQCPLSNFQEINIYRTLNKRSKKERVDIDIGKINYPPTIDKKANLLRFALLFVIFFSLVASFL